MREERDALGAIEVPNERYYGATTARSLKNFAIGSQLMPRAMIDALLFIKAAAAKTNMELGLLPKEKGVLIAYLNTQGVNPGAYDLDIHVHYDNKETKRRSEIVVNFDSILFTPTGQVIGQKSFFRENAIFIIIIGILVVINLVWFYYLRRLTGRKNIPLNHQ